MTQVAYISRLFFIKDVFKLSDQTVPPKSNRKLRAAPETVRQRAERTSANPKTKRNFHIHFPTSFIKSLPIWRPIKIIGHYIIPPYFRNSWHELRLVTWPNRKTSLQLTWAVILFSVIFAVLIGSFDFVLGKLFKDVIIK